MPKPSWFASAVRVYRRRGRWLLAGITTLALATGALAYAAASPTSTPSVELASPGAGRLARAYGFDPRMAIAVATLRDGDQLGVVSSDSERCLIRTRDGEIDNEACAPLDGLASTRAITVTDECGAASRHLMEITGLAPDAATTVHLISTDGATEVAAVETGTFKFEGVNPTPGRPYPTTVEWLDGVTVVGQAALPVLGDRFCLPAE